MPKKSAAVKSKNKAATVSSTKDAQTRKLKNPAYRSFRLNKRLKHPDGSLPTAPKLFWRSLVHLKQHWKLFSGIILIYLLLSIVLVRGFSSSTELTALKEDLQSVFKGQASQLGIGLALFGVLVGTSGTASSEAGAVYQSILLIAMSLVIIWAVRQTTAKVSITVKESFYRSMYPLVPFILVLLVIGLQLIPLAVGNSVYSIVIGNGLAVSFLEKLLWALVFGLLALLSLYMITSSLFALYIVTLPDITPMQALRSARELVRHRRWAVMRKIIFLPIVLLLVGVVIMLPLILLLTPLAEWAFLIIALSSLAVIHSYMYSVYRALL